MDTICMSGLLPYLIIYIYYESYIALCIFINGIILHSSPEGIHNNIRRYWDLLWNGYFIIYINVFSIDQPMCTLGTVTLLYAYTINNSSVIHALFIQQSFAYFLIHYLSELQSDVYSIQEILK